MLEINPAGASLIEAESPHVLLDTRYSYIEPGDLQFYRQLTTDVFQGQIGDALVPHSRPKGHHPRDGNARDRENNIIALLGITRDITDKKRAEEAEQTDFAERLNSLSDRERETLDILIKGYTAKEAALVLGISHRNC